ncbi:MAG TPA: FKBP-type peptidyl-prolyl cis-trans isomerase [Candidatus Paceibacterota bacterium]|nr:FKBP-type peptidyl-prolyl cis-trans isomerase [Candidatus Paceibacterota bacterium]
MKSVIGLAIILAALLGLSYWGYLEFSHQHLAGQSAGATSTQTEIATTTKANTINTENNNTMDQNTGGSSTGIGNSSQAGEGQLMISDITVGTGTEAEQGDTVFVTYTGTLANGTVFDASSKHGGQPFSFTLGSGQVIPGWEQGILGMKVGGKRKLVIPPSLAYGANGIPGAIPPNATLTFVVELTNVEQQ